MNLKFMKAKDLDQRIKGLFKKECDLLHEVLITVQEISRRRLHEEFGYTSVYTYLVQGIGYSEGTAYRHIQAAKLLAEVPEVGVKIQNGEISLAQLNLVQQAVKLANNKSDIEVSRAQKAEILEQIVNQSVFASEKLVAQILDIPVIKNNHLKPQADDSVLATLSIPKEIYDKIEQAQNLISHSLESKDLVKFLEYAADLIIKQKTSVRVFKSESAKNKSKSLVNDAVASNDRANIETGAANESCYQENLHVAANSEQAQPNKKLKQDARPNVKLNSMLNSKPEPKLNLQPKPFTPRQRKIVLQRDKCCQHRDSKTKRQCQNNWQLQADHKIPLWAGGESALENGQVLCGVHNRRKYRQEAGIRPGK